jgi:hypothetical protein
MTQDDKIGWFKVSFIVALCLFVLLAIPLSSVRHSAVRAQNIPNYVADPCFSFSTPKSSASISIASATTVQLVASAAGKAIYVCGFTFSISQVVTTANTLQFEYSTVASCASSVTAATGTFGAGGVTAGTPIVITSPADGTDFTVPAGNALCAVTAIGGSGSFQGVLSYVQQ